MPPNCLAISGTLTPFLYPFVFSATARRSSRFVFNSLQRRNETTNATTITATDDSSQPTYEEGSHLNPPPSDYSRTIFTDKATINAHAGSGGHGCISFLREKYIEAGPANGGDGGSGGNIYIQAVRGETSLHKLARRSILKAGRGKNGQGKTRGGERGDDIVIQVPVGTVVREIEREDPVFIEEQRMKLEAGKRDGEDPNGPWKWSRDKWLLYPAVTPEDIATAEFPTLPKPRRPALAVAQVKSPISLDLSVPMDRPILLAAGAVGGMGNPHFVTRTVPRPKFATKGSTGMRVMLQLELKLLADVGLVGLPNAGKSTLLRAMSKSRARVGDWAFTTLQPNIGTVVLDDHQGRPVARSTLETGEPRTNYTIADIPGLVQDAHLDRGLGISFLRHVERARVLAFVIDLNAGDAVQALRALWKEVGEYERMKIQEETELTEPLVEWSPFRCTEDALNNRQETIIVNTGPTFDSPLAPQVPSIAGKPWFVVATKADLPETRENFEKLQIYLDAVGKGECEHPSGQKNFWDQKVEAIPISAINGHGTNKITDWVVDLLDR
ncbi:putative mitochondrial GTPase 2 [Venustampulla echinocandica]|uniref:Putative mitochondrial GTPase 2 n=1 Tax=Venustampulla echinocandica TaxID=2656787 RepID=A0A370TJV6_9HELO|nr:putative mitochondrial GTPase 2 [Venustampulla echinocandica]RDL35811.1 putative mitochondrial GTPase 2 [Venustampulla echinocandica]